MNQITTYDILEEIITEALKGGREEKYGVAVNTTKEDLETMGFEDVDKFLKLLKTIKSLYYYYYYYCKCDNYS